MFARLAFLLFSLGAFSLNSETTRSVLLNCWDGSFNYRVATLAVHDNRVEIGITGKNFTKTILGSEIKDLSGISITDSNSLYFSFLRSECKNTNSTWTCHKKASDMLQGFSNRLFTKRVMFNLDDMISLLAKVRISELEVMYREDGIHVKITRDYGMGTPSVVEVNFDLLHCSLSGEYGNTFFGNAEFPSELRDYLINH